MISYRLPCTGEGGAAAYKKEFPETEKEGFFSFLKGKVPKFELPSLQTRLLVWGDRGRRGGRGNYADHGRGEEPSNGV